MCKNVIHVCFFATAGAHEGQRVDEMPLFPVCKNYVPEYYGHTSKTSVILKNSQKYGSYLP